MIKLKGVRLARNLSVIVTLGPIVLLGLLIWQTTTNVPFWDQWEMVPMIENFKNGQLSWSDVWQQHNEHRLLLPNIILLVSAIITRWNTQVECFLSLITAIGSFYIMKSVLQRSAALLKREISLFLALFLSLVWFSPVQAENWLWGWQLEWFLNVLGVMIAAYIIAKADRTKLGWRDLAILVAAALIAQYSLGNGTLLWLLIILSLLYQNVAKLKIAVVAMAGFVASLLYFRQYVIPASSSKSLFLEDPRMFMEYVFIYLGRPLTFLRTGAILAGMILCLSFIGLNIYLFLKRRKTFSILLPWTLLGAYAIASAGLTAISRMELGLAQAYSSRYTTIATLLVVSLAVSLSMTWQDLTKTFSQHYKRLIAVGLILTSLLAVIINIAWGVHYALGHKTDTQYIKQCTSLPSPTDACLLSAYPYLEIIKPRLDYLKRINWAGY